MKGKALYRGRNTSLDLLRILACLGVIIIHTAGSPIYHNFVQSGTLWYNECLIMDALVRWSVPVFAMLTGFFLLDSKKEVSIKIILTKYVLRIAVALVAWSSFYAFTFHKPILPFGSQEGHFWYLSMLIGLYLSIPILRIIAHNKTLLAYFCWIWMFFMCYRFIGNFYTLPFSLDNVLFVDYAGYALWGVYCIRLLRRVKAWILTAVLGCGLLVTAIASIVTQNQDTIFFSYLSPNTIVVSIILFYFFASTTWRGSGWSKQIITRLSNCTFGIYLIHLWIGIQLFFRVYRFVEHPIILTLICTSLVFIGGLFITSLLKKIPFIKNYLC